MTRDDSCCSGIQCGDAAWHEASTIRYNCSESTRSIELRQPPNPCNQEILQGIGNDGMAYAEWIQQKI